MKFNRNEIESERGDNDDDLCRSLHQNQFRDNISIHDLMPPTDDKAQDLDRLRTTLRNSIFKARPSSNLKQGINWELVYARVNISSVNITLSCAVEHHRAVRGDSVLPTTHIRPVTLAATPLRTLTATPTFTRSMVTPTPEQQQSSFPSSSSVSLGQANPQNISTEEKKERTDSMGSYVEPSTEIITVQCKFTSINIKAKHRTMDTKLSFSIRDLDVIDVVSSTMKGTSYHNK